MSLPAITFTDSGTFLDARTFKCNFLNARVTPEECRRRQGSSTTQRRIAGLRVTMAGDALYVYCRSGVCQQGLVQLGRGRKVRP